MGPIPPLWQSWQYHQLCLLLHGVGMESASMSKMSSAPSHPFPSLGWGRRAGLFLSKSDVPMKKNQKTTEQIIAANAALIDESVTTDIHRVFRMPGTLHGTSGMLKMRVDSLEGFDPQTQPVVLGEEIVTVQVNYAPEFYLKGRKFGPYDSASVRLPTYAAVFLLARGLGGVAG